MIKIIASNHFVKFKKRSHEALQMEIDRQVRALVEHPDMGEMKKGDLKGVRVHKFKYNNQLYLLAYEAKGEVLYLYLIGSHENYYKKLKKYLS